MNLDNGSKITPISHDANTIRFAITDGFSRCSILVTDEEAMAVAREIVDVVTLLERMAVYK